MQEYLQAYRETLEKYQGCLAQITPETLAARQAEGGWGPGEVFIHVLKTSELFLRQADAALRAVEHAEKEKNPGGHHVFKHNGIPDIRVQMPEGVDIAPHQPESLSEITAGFERLTAAMETMAVRIPAEDQGGKALHPSMGFLSAVEWFRAVEIHMRHHLRQLERLGVLQAEASQG